MNDEKIYESKKAVEVTDIIGGYGPWQRNLFVLLFLSCIPSTWHNLMITFVAPTGLDFWCARPPDFNNSEYKSMSTRQWRNRTSPTTYREQNRCEMVEFWTNSSETVKCTAWEYNTTFYESTIIDEWDLVCDSQWLISLSISIYNIGYMVALIVCGQLSDNIGRRPVLLLCYVINIAAGILSAFSTSFAVFAVLRFFTAFGGAGFYTITFVLLVELVSPEHRPSVGISVNFGWCLAFVSLPGVAWIVRDWFWLQLVVTLPKLLFFPVFWMVPESPRWLLAKQKTDKYREVVMKAALKNGRSSTWVTSQIDKLLLSNEKVLEDTEEDEKKNNFFSLFITPGLWMYSLNLLYSWLANSFVYYALSYNTENLAGNVYLNFFASGAVEFPAYICAIFVIKKMGRRIPLSVGMCAAGTAFALTLGIPDSNSLFWLKNVLSLIGKFFIAGTFATLYVYSAEIYPTVIRSIAVGAGSAVARVGSTAAPFLRELDTTADSSINNAIYAILSITSGILILFLPETNNLRFTDTLDEIGALKQIKKTEPKGRISLDVF